MFWEDKAFFASLSWSHFGDYDGGPNFPKVRRVPWWRWGDELLREEQQIEACYYEVYF
jgi:hypothetical protein